MAFASDVIQPVALVLPKTNAKNVNSVLFLKIINVSSNAVLINTLKMESVRNVQIIVLRVLIICFVPHAKTNLL